MRKALVIAFVVLVLGLTFAPALHAQGCVMCYTSAAGEDPAAARKLDFAILALLIPVLTLFAGVMALAIHRRNVEVEKPSKLPESSPLPRARTSIRFRLELPPSAGD